MQYRSDKVEFKAQEKQADDPDPQTKDEKEYLGEELFAILQGAKEKEALLHMDEEGLKQDPKDAAGSLINQGSGDLGEQDEDGTN